MHSPARTLSSGETTTIKRRTHFHPKVRRLAPLEHVLELVEDLRPAAMLEPAPAAPPNERRVGV